MKSLWMLSFVLVASSIACASAWSNEELELFDLVEEVNANFYEFLDTTQDATTSEIRKAYRRQSLLWHPDKNSDPTAEVHFRQLTAIYDILKDDEMRKRYNEVLRDGLPNWQQPIYYYRRMRKMPAWETAVIILFMVSCGHYLCLWAVYLEKKWTMEDTLLAKLRKKEKQLRRKNKDVDELIDQNLQTLSKPTFYHLFPILLTCWLYNVARTTPANIRSCYVNYKRVKQEALAKKLEIEEIEPEEEEEPELKRERKKQRRKEIMEMNELAASQDRAELVPVCHAVREHNTRSVEDIKEGGDWSVEEIANLIRLQTKFPMGTPDRWEKVARALRRSPLEVTDMVGQLKKLDPKEYQKLIDMCQKPTTTSSSSTDAGCKDIAASSADTIGSSGTWSNTQQQLLEQALQTYPKGTDERWEKIASCVPGKSKDEVVARYKELVEMVKAKKAQQ